MNARTLKWTAAVAISCGLHAGAAGFIGLRAPQVEIAGGGTTEIAIAGNAFADQLSSGETIDEVAPVIDETPAMVEPETVTEIAPEPTATPVESEAVEVAVAETPVETVEPAEQAEIAVAAADAPLPTPRPDYVPPRKTVQENKPQPRETRKAETRQKKQRTSGSRGQDRQDAQRGSASGRQNAGEAAKGRQTARASQSGNARTSNYPGKIVSKLRRSLRYPSAAKRERLRGEAHVRFTVAQNGAVSGVRVVRSSGSPVLDKAAIETVHRAAPFPSIPADAGRSSWGFTVPLAFKR